MKVTFTPIKQSEQPKFPCLRKHKDDGYIVMFVSQYAGIIVEAGDVSPQRGFCSCNWVECTDSDVWERIPDGKVEIEIG